MSQESDQRVPVRGNGRKSLPPLEFLQECFDPNFEEGTLIWRERPLHHFPSIKAMLGWNGRFAGTEAGSKGLKKDGSKRYRDVGLKFAAGGKAYLYSVHLILWLMAGRTLEIGEEIDHISKDPWDNRLENLRRCTAQQNIVARGRMSTKGGSLPKWVYRDGTCLFSKIVENGKVHIFRESKDPMELHLLAFRKMKELHGEFANCGCTPPCQI